VAWDKRVLSTCERIYSGNCKSWPVAFFNANKAGDLISRINNDTDKLNQFFSQTLVQFVGSIVIMIGAAIFLLSINLKLGAAALAPALVLFVLTRILSPWINARMPFRWQQRAASRGSIGEPQTISQVVVAFNRRDFFRKRFEVTNDENYASAIRAGIANNTFTPIYGFSSNIAQLIVLAYGVYLITTGSFTLGLLIGFIAT